SDRQKVAEGVRDQRIRTYPAAWERTGVVSRWPHTDATRGHASRLHRDLRTWYYSGGGLYLSEDARERYEHFQVVLEAIVAQDPDHPIAEYDDLIEAVAREQRVGARVYQSQGATARKSPEPTQRVPLTDQDERLRLPDSDA
ncbi:MAG: hypothetical protein ABJA74_12260, partial [Lapillicoccus sp.]